MEQFVNDITVWAAAADWLRVVITFAVIVIPTVLILWLTLFASDKAIAAVRKLYQQARPAFDQVTDPLVLAIAARTGMTAADVVKWLTSADGLLLTANSVLRSGNAPLTAKMVDVKAVRGPSEPAREVNIGGGVK